MGNARQEAIGKLKSRLAIGRHRREQMFANSEFEVRGFGDFALSLDSLQQEVQVRIHFGGKIRRHEGCRAVFTDDGGTTDHLSVT